MDKSVFNHHSSVKKVQCNQEDLLDHPLVTSLLRHKWNKYGRYFYYGNLLIYILFMVFLTGYIVVTKPPFYYQQSVCKTFFVRYSNNLNTIFSNI